MIDPAELRNAFLALSSEMPEPFELVGVTYHGPEGHRDWVAFLRSDDDERPMGCEGWGDTPFGALQDLRSHMRTEHPKEFGAIGEG